ncbi:MULTISPECIES: hypothetical protein [Paenibacillus]|uniref:Uncharacterized protein n=2 Tax=Paenibacillus TaxID=44249 RepID=A0A1V4HJQ3_9BACL|nr:MULTISPECIES: hypothetical protein [Paenibacillus]MEC0232524.1 hypothetical protein [Paenibacillus alba]NQX64562.1 hypothetical protein [Paenibacillus alba]OPH57492.1 hypothetical protein BC351_02900 [Paenibacillus ferrarius]
MSQANIPNITPIISITLGGAVNLLLASIALEELALAHIVNAEAEKIQYVLGTLTPLTPPIAPTISNILLINESVRKTLQDVIKKEMLLQFKMDSIMEHFPNTLA